jgi:diguanylate cyclase (GGDEF)-like protein/PAS domain S-box-containing protein
MKLAKPQPGQPAAPAQGAVPTRTAAARTLRLVILDAEGALGAAAEAALGEDGTSVQGRRVADAQQFLQALQVPPEVILACAGQGEFGANQALDLLAELGIEVPLIVLMNAGQQEREADEVLRRGAADLVTSERMWRLRFCVPRVIERQRLLDEARRDKARYRLTFDNVPAGIITTGANGELLSINAAGLRILGYEGEAAYLDATTPDNRACCAIPQDLHNYVRRLKEYGSVHNHETVLRRADGELRPAALSGRRIRDTANAGWLAITIIEDLTARRETESALLSSERRLSGLVDSAMDGILMVDEALQIVLANPAAQRMFGAAHAEMLGATLQSFMPAEFTESLARSERSGVAAVLARRRDGAEFPVEVSVAALVTPQGRLFTAFLRDLTERTLQEKRIARLSRVQAMFSSINSAIVRIRERGELLKEICRIAVAHGNLCACMVALLDDSGAYNRAVAVAGVNVEGVLGKLYPVNLQDPPAHDLMSFAMHTRQVALDNDLESRRDLGGIHEGGVARGYRSAIALPLVVDEKAAGVFLLAGAEPGFFTGDEVQVLQEMAADVSLALESLHQAERVNHLAFYDALTDLPNRNLFQERLIQTLRRSAGGQSVVPLVLMDIERFRFVNETLGRQAGDELLQQVATRLRALAQGELGNYVQEVARIASNVFGLALGGIRDSEQATLAIKQILRQVFALPFDIHGSELRVRSRCGVSLYPSDGVDSDQLLRNAEAALGNAKRSADAFLFYAPEMNAHAADVLALENKLRRAIELDQFVLHYQPKVSMLDRSVTGVEALLRWQDPDTGLVPPARFIPILEETGMIFEVGRWAMQQAIRDYKSWITRGLFAPRIAVNISPLQLRHRDFLADIRRTLEEHVEAVVGLDFEITESMIMEDLDHNIDTLAQIRDFGINVAIDDFGTGYSSLSYLAKLPLSMLKIDRSFVVSMTQTPQGFAIVSTIIALAHALNLRVVAEGVETEEQAKFLRVLNCDEIQGYLISKPVPIEKLERLLAGNVTPLHGPRNAP